MRVLITGAGGLLGHDIAAACAAAGDDVIALDRTTLDVTDRDAVLGAITTVWPDAVINCAAWTDVDACEADPLGAFATNGLAVRWLAEACDRTAAHLVHISTDYVFDGTLDRPYVEWDATNPISVYAHSKLAGEHEAAALGTSAAVVRTSWVNGEHGDKLVQNVLRKAADDTPMTFVDDRRGCPTFAVDLAPMLRRIAVDRRTGIHHVTSQGAVSPYEFVREILLAAGRPPALVTAIGVADLAPSKGAPRPANSVLDNAVLRAAGLPLLRDFREPLAELVAALAG